MSDDSEFITNASQIAAVSPTDLPFEVHHFKGLKNHNGKTPKCRVYAVSVGDYNDYIDSTRIYRDGVMVGQDFKDDDLKLMWWACRDASHNHLWRSVEEAVSQIRTWPLPVKNALRDTVNRINSIQPDEVVEGNSGGGQNDSPPSGSAPTSESGTSTDS